MISWYQSDRLCVCGRGRVNLSSPQCVWAPSLGWHQPGWWSPQLGEEPGRQKTMFRIFTFLPSWLWHLQTSVSQLSNLNIQDQGVSVNLTASRMISIIWLAVDTYLIRKLLADQRHYQWSLPHLGCAEKGKTFLIIICHYTRLLLTMSH